MFDNHEQLIDTAEVARRLSCGRTNLYYMVKAGQFPAPLKVGRLCRWRVATVDAWIMRQSREDSAQGDPGPTDGRETAAGAASPAPDGGRV